MSAPRLLRAVALGVLVALLAPDIGIARSIVAVVLLVFAFKCTDAEARHE